MLTLRDIKIEVCAMNGDTTGADSVLYNDRLTNYVNWAIRDIEQEIRRKAPHCAWMKKMFVIETNVLGTGGDYALPLDFKSAVSEFGVNGTVDGSISPIEGVDLQTFDKVNVRRSFDRMVYTIHGREPQLYIQFWPTPLRDGVTINVRYDAKQPRLVSDNDPLTLFPEDDGWEEVILWGTAKRAHAFHQGSFQSDFTNKYKEALADKLSSINSDAPNDGQIVPFLDDTAKRFEDMRRRYMG